MLETSRICSIVFSVRRAGCAGAVAVLAACATVEPPPASPSVATVAPASAPATAIVPAAPTPGPLALAEEARAMLAQAETDIQRARGKRALWSRAWESLVLARAAHEARDAAGTIRQARRASELAQLGLEQLAFPAVAFPAPAAARAASPKTAAE